MAPGRAMVLRRRRTTHRQMTVSLPCRRRWDGAVAMLLYAAYGTWRAHTGALVAQENEAARLERVVHRCALRMQSLKHVAAFAGWVQAKINARSYRPLLGVALSRWQRRTASSCFAAWIELVESRVAGREVMVRMLRRLSQRQIYAAWRSWRGYFHRSRRKTHTTIV